MYYRVLFQQQGQTFKIVTYERWNDMLKAIAEWMHKNPEKRARNIFVTYTDI